MTATRLGLFDGRLLTLFPRQLQNTAVSPTLLVKDKYARLVQNIIPNQNKSGSGAKRYGMGKKGDVLVGNIVDSFEIRKSDGSLQILDYTDDGSLWSLNEGSGAYTLVKSGLSTLGPIGALPFNGKLILYNGIDRCFSWDGTTTTDLGEWVNDVLADNTSFTWVSTSSVTIKPNAVRASSDYAIGTQIRVKFATAGLVTAIVASTSYNAGTNVLTINVTGTPFPALSEVISKIEYFAYPPAFSFMFAHLDMLWGLSPGELKARTYRGADGMKAYYQAAANNENSWFDFVGTDPTQDVPFINMRNKVPQFDELVAMSSIDGDACFHGRHYLLIYTGEDPSTVGGFVWAKTIPVGTVHGKLVQRFPGDTLFVTPYGARSLRRVFQTEEAEVVPDLGSDIDPTIQEKINTLMSEDAAYKKARSFYYPKDGLYGFKLDDSLLVYVLSEESKGWVLFTGLFATATAFLATTDGRLLIGVAGQLYAYANGSDSQVGIDYSDDGAAISCKWWIPWVATGAGRWSNRAWEVILEDAQTSEFYIDRFINYDQRNVVTTQFNVISNGAAWDAADWDVDDWDGVPVNPVESDKFLADSFSFMLRHENTTGPLNILGVRPIGR